MMDWLGAAKMPGMNSSDAPWPTAVRVIEACNVPLGPRYKPQRMPERAGKGLRPLSSLEMLFALLRAVCGASLRHPIAVCLVIGLLVAVDRPEIPAWVPRGAVVRAAIALENRLYERPAFVSACSHGATFACRREAGHTHSIALISLVIF